MTKTTFRFKSVSYGTTIRHTGCLSSRRSSRAREILLRLVRSGSAGLNVTAIADPIHMSMTAVSKHLQVLRLAGLIKPRTRGTSTEYRADLRRLAQVRRWFKALDAEQQAA